MALALGVVLWTLGVNWSSSLLVGSIPFIATIARTNPRAVRRLSSFGVMAGVFLIASVPGISLQTMRYRADEILMGPSVDAMPPAQFGKGRISLEAMLSDLKAACDKQLLTAAECEEKRAAILGRFTPDWLPDLAMRQARR